MNIHSIKRVYNKRDNDFSYYFIDFRGIQYAVSREEFLEVAHSTYFILGDVKMPIDNKVCQINVWLVY